MFAIGVYEKPNISLLGELGFGTALDKFVLPLCN